MPDINITSNELQLVKQRLQRHYIKLTVLNQSWNEKGVIQGKLLSCNINIDASSSARRSASLSIVVDTLSLKTAAQISMDTYIQIKCGLENNNTKTISWYNFGYFIVNQSSFKFDPTSRTLDLSLSDLMIDLNGDRAGSLHAYTSLVKNEQKISDVMTSVLKLAGYTSYSIQAFGVVRSESNYYETKNDFEKDKIPYNIDFSVGVTAFEILDKLVQLYPYYVMYFDTHGTFVCERDMCEQNASSVMLDDKSLRELVISEDTSIDWTGVKNHVEVWGKDGLYHGEASDENPLSPFNIKASQDMLLVISGSGDYGVDTNNICDKYKDADKQVEYEKQKAHYEEVIADYAKIENPTSDETTKYYNARSQLNYYNNQIAGNIAYKGNDLAQEWAEYMVYKKARTNDSITLQTVFMPFITDVGFKISYCTKADNQTRTYLVQSVSHDPVGGTTTLNCMRFYNDNVSAYWDVLPIPTIASYSIDGMEITITSSEVPNATSYMLIIDSKIVATSTSRTFVYTMPEEFEGEHKIYVGASADGWRDSISNGITVELYADTLIVTNAGDELVTDDNDNIIANEEVD